MSNDALPPLLILLSSLLPGLIIFFLPEKSVRLRTALNLCGALFKVAVVIVVLQGVYAGLEYSASVPFLPGNDLVLRIDSLALLFVTLSAGLWLVMTVYAVSYLEDSPNRSRFFGFYSLCVSATVGIAMAGDLLTLFVFYELLTIATYPLVVHNGTPEARRAGTVYLAFTIGGGVLLLAGTVWVQTLAVSTNFLEVAGVLEGLGQEHETALRLIFALMVGGFGVKAAVVPLHQWLPRAMVAPAPVSALLHAVAVVKAGAFGIIRVVYDVYGVELSHALGLSDALAVLATATILYGSFQALRQDDLKLRLAYSTVSQVSYILLGIALYSPLASIGGLSHLVHQGLMKITLFLCAGNLGQTLGIHKVSEMNGAGARMPWTMAAFSVAALGMIGLPPFAGFISKWYLGSGAVQSGAGWALVVLLISSLLNAAYFLPILSRVWFRKQTGPWPEEKSFGRFETKAGLLFPPVTTAIATVAVGLFAGTPVSPLSWIRDVVAVEYRL
ncbi:MAG TPA: proton-conducting transporter membrane subunit [Pedomonas sp.]|uniref:complex I subunit 5 family protein n=1 Tax=Pedomonas sp. TaxID=2976421 RepID=UPI002F3FE32C